MGCIGCGCGREKSRRSWEEARTIVDQASRKIELGGIPRTAVFSGLTGQDYERMAGYFDYILPKQLLLASRV